ncbi:MAG: class I SAM-dependent methyltransferase [Caldilineaceae bacterium]
MTTPKKSDAVYVAGDSDRERKRLQEQSNLFNPSTIHLFERAGIVPGMRVLDVGSGAGDVALLLADIVGKDGAVVGVDTNSAILETAQGRVAAAGYSNVSFIAGDIRNVALEGQFDAMVGRLVLMYLAHPVEAIQRSMKLLRPGGIVAFQEFDATTCFISAPHTSICDKLKYWIVETFRHAGMELQMGFKLRNTFTSAGLPAPQMHLDAIIGGGENWAGYAYAVNTVRSILPYIEKFGVATREEVDIDTLTDRFRNEIVSQNGVVMISTWVSAWTQV